MSTLFGKKPKKHVRKRVRTQEDEGEEEHQQQQQQQQHDCQEVLEVPQEQTTTTTSWSSCRTTTGTNTTTIVRAAAAAPPVAAAAAAAVVLPSWSTFADLGLADPLVATCRQLGLRRPTAVQRTIIPFLLQKNCKSHVLALASTGSGKTAAFILPILQHLSVDPYGIFAVILTPTRELAKQIHQQVLAFGSGSSSSGAGYNVRSCLCIGGVDAVRQSLDLSNQRPHFCVATPGRLAELLRGPSPPALHNLRFMVLDEADRLLASNSGFERDVAELLLHSSTHRHHYQQQQQDNTDTTRSSVVGPTLQQGPGRRPCRAPCQTLLFSATMSRSLQSVEEMAGAGMGRLPLTRFVIQDDDNNNNENDKIPAAALPNKKLKTQHDRGDDNDDDETTCKAEPDGNSNNNNKKAMEESLRPRIPAGLKQEYIFMPSRVRDAYLLAAIRNLMMNGGRPVSSKDGSSSSRSVGGGSGWTASATSNNDDNDEHDTTENNKARSAIIFVATCERAAFVSGILTTMGVQNVALHSLLSQNRRLASLGKFKSQQVCVMVATDVASRGLDIPTVDLVLNSELPRNAINYVHRCGRTARANRRGRAISFVAESDIALVHAAESISGRALEKCIDITDDLALKMLGPVAKAARLTRIKLNDIGFDELVQKFQERKARDAKERARIDRALRKMTTKKKQKNNNKNNSNNDKTENP
jgi:ATP-dependent RNA helicase DDX49/DBP8